MTVAAIYENGMLKPQEPLELAEGAQVQVTIFDHVALVERGITRANHVNHVTLISGSGMR